MYALLHLQALKNKTDFVTYNLAMFVGLLFEYTMGVEDGRLLVFESQLFFCGHLVEDLESIGAEITPLIVYRTQCPESDPDAADTLVSILPGIVTFTSASTVDNFRQLLGDSRIEGLKGHTQYASIGPQTSGVIEACGLKPYVEASMHTTEGLVQCILDAIEANR